uniref:Uncharacterized protein n=1 Tax=Cacopsylla melanoneura TaxID=428564 RepID=A0A8D8TA97_9HEMI
MIFFNRIWFSTSIFFSSSFVKDILDRLLVDAVLLFEFDDFFDISEDLPELDRVQLVDFGFVFSRSFIALISSRMSNAASFLMSGILSSSFFKFGLIPLVCFVCGCLFSFGSSGLGELLLRLIILASFSIGL